MVLDSTKMSTCVHACTCKKIPQRCQITKVKETCIAKLVDTHYANCREVCIINLSNSFWIGLWFLDVLCAMAHLVTAETVTVGSSTTDICLFSTKTMSLRWDKLQ